MTSGAISTIALGAWDGVTRVTRRLLITLLALVAASLVILVWSMCWTQRETALSEMIT